MAVKISIMKFLNITPLSKIGLSTRCQSEKVGTMIAHVCVSLCSGYNFKPFDLFTSFLVCKYRVTTAQGKRGIWMLTFPDRKTQGI